MWIARMQIFVLLAYILLAVQGRHRHFKDASRVMYGGGVNYYPANNGYGNQIPYNYDIAAAQSLASASAAASASGNMMSASASASASTSVVHLQKRWTGTQTYCNTVLGRVSKFISKIEEVVVGLPLTMIKAALGVPTDVVKLSISLAESLLPNLTRAKELLEGFFQTVFDLPAKALYGTVSIFFDLVNKVLDWGQTCHGMPVCTNPLPSVGGYGPCAGQWPCTRVTACQKPTCLNAARAIQAETAVQSGTTEDEGVTNESDSTKPKRYF